MYKGKRCLKIFIITIDVNSLSAQLHFQIIDPVWCSKTSFSKQNAEQRPNECQKRVRSTFVQFHLTLGWTFLKCFYCVTASYISHQRTYETMQINATRKKKINNKNDMHPFPLQFSTNSIEEGEKKKQQWQHLDIYCE